MSIYSDTEGEWSSLSRVSGKSCGDTPNLGPITEIPNEPKTLPNLYQIFKLLVNI
jgi:hypothetical protein